MTLENCSNIFDKEFSQKNVLYYPWVGKDYCKTSPKVLIVGESHYYSPDLIDDPVNPYFCSVIKVISFLN